MVDSRNIQDKTSTNDAGNHNALNVSEAQELERFRKLSILWKDTTEIMAQGILVHDGTNILFCNSRANDLLDIPTKILAPGKSVRGHLLFRITRGDMGDVVDAEKHVDEILLKAKEGDAGNTISKLANGMIIRSDSVARPGGGQIVTFTDITMDHAYEAELQDIRNQSNELNILNHSLKKSIHAVHRALMGYTLYRIIL